MALGQAMQRLAEKSMPPAKGWPPGRDFLMFLGKASRALLELARARKKFADISVRQIQALNALPRSKEAGATNGRHEAECRWQIAWIAYVVPRIARAVPWRSDCLVQALAAQHWLAAEGIESEIVIGVERPDDAEFGAHAWLKCGDAIVTGGETDRYTIIL